MNFDPWIAILQRDPAFDGRLFYGVTSTGVYCRPSCPSRRPRRENARFFENRQDAEAAGFRACRRCRPQLAGDDESRLVKRVVTYLEAHPAATLQQLGDIAGLSPFHLQRVFRKATGITPRAFVEERRRQLLQAKLRQSADVTSAVFDSGFNSAGRAYARSTQELGMTPATFRKGGAGVAIHYAITSCELGWLLVATTERGICAVRLGDSDDGLEEAFQKDFTHAERHKHGPLMDAIDQILLLIAGQDLRTDLPLDIRATAFQRRVWDYLRTIPRGQTRTYSQVAAGLGQPTAARAVARACATNELALLIPCHRVVAATGALAGYRWGVGRKRKLLDREASIAR